MTESARMTASPDLDKTALRRLLRARRQAIVRSNNSNIFECDNSIFLHIKSTMERAAIVAIYQAVGSECDVIPIILRALPAGVRLALPCADRKDQPMQFRSWTPGDPLVTSALGFLQPADSAATVEPDVIFTPLLGFDRAMNRLGQGAGHYDRAFAALPAARRIGVAWAVQEIEALPADPWDVPLDAILTDREWITAPDSNTGN